MPDCENEELITSNSDRPRNLFERFEELFEDDTTDLSLATFALFGVLALHNIVNADT